jgi:thymidylate kinase
MKNIFIAIEGIDNSGKTTLANNLASEYERQGVPLLHTQEP